MKQATPHIVVIGAGIGGLAAALRLAHAGARVSVIDQHAQPGGKMRTVPSDAGPVDAGPTVLTMKHVFDALFSSVGARIDDHVTLTQEPVLARHFWSDGTTLDLMSDPAESAANIDRAFGASAAVEFSRFADRARKLFHAFDAPMMQSASPTLAGMTARVLQNPMLIPAMAPHHSLARTLSRQFSDPRLAQLFARYATYVGGVPTASPALLSLIAHAESMGVWHVKGGMHQLARAIVALATSFGATFTFDTPVTRIEMQDGRAAAVHTRHGRITADAIVFNGDPQALHLGLLGPAVTTATPAQVPRSLSAYVMAFAAQISGQPLAAHNVFFADDPQREYAPLMRGDMQTDPTLYLCAQDRFGGNQPQGSERFELIMNAAPTDQTRPTPKEDQRCLSLISDRLQHFGLRITPALTIEQLTQPAGFAQMFPGSHGSLYGRSPHGMMAAFKRPTARTAVRGLYLTGGGAHPGAGVPMATLSAQHAAAAIMQDLGLTSMSRPAVMRGGMSTA